jgi:hypothetical protein
MRYMIKTELELFKNSISWKQKPSQSEKELLEQLEAFSWTLGEEFITHWVRRCGIIF